MSLVYVAKSHMCSYQFPRKDTKKLKIVIKIANDLIFSLLNFRQSRLLRLNMSSPTSGHDAFFMTCDTAKLIARISESLVFSLIFLGIVINSTVCGIMLRNKCVLKNLSNFFVFHLSVVDLIFRLLTVGPLIYLSTVYTTEQAHIPCKLFHFFSSACGAAFFVTLVVVSVDVYRDAAMPLKGLMSRRTPFLIVLGVWLYAAVCSGPVMYSAQSVYYSEISEITPNMTTGELKNCSVPKLCDFLRNWGGQLSSTLFFLMAFLAPLVVVVTLFVITYVYLRRDYNKGTISKETASTKRKVTRMLTVLSLGVVICWGPTVFVSMVRSYDAMNNVPSDAVLILTIVSELMKFLNSLFNPLIFAYYIPNFKKDWFWLCACCKCNGRRNKTEQPSVQPKHLHVIQSTEYRDSQTMM